MNEYGWNCNYTNSDTIFNDNTNEAVSPKSNSNDYVSGEKLSKFYAGLAMFYAHETIHGPFEALNTAEVHQMTHFQKLRNIFDGYSSIEPSMSVLEDDFEWNSKSNAVYHQNAERNVACDWNSVLFDDEITCQPLETKAFTHYESMVQLGITQLDSQGTLQSSIDDTNEFKVQLDSQGTLQSHTNDTNELNVQLENNGQETLSKDFKVIHSIHS
jgi:hypothetical protein